MRVRRKKITAKIIDARHLHFGLLSALLLTLFPLFSQTEISDDIIPIAELNSRNSAFKQLERAVQNSYRVIALNSGKKDGKEAVPVSFFSYFAGKEETLLMIAARCSIRYETIATLNRISSPQMNISGTTILIPSCPGLFIPDKPKTPFESLLKKNAFH
ncbi:MAG: LysM peptidoglycan-binding domain-containing protein [Bacteroides sp.]|nr:LysM peptidoglycan-binding domain-containing protein [Prevotella sp.]MCM1407599.1 LysM peptidoglycan-binding domain-containing protein [Treponema brennaborense]MCM1469251.1 LysM peptidoglycan-binding domain-containing protein [Bacteroides sp.]